MRETQKKKVMLWIGAGQIGRAIARRMGTGMKMWSAIKEWKTRRQPQGS